LTVSYNIETEAAGLFIPRLTAYYRDEVYIGLDYISPEFDQSYIDAYSIMSARLTWIPDDQWNITAFVDNLADKEYFQGGFAVMDALGAGTVVKGPPRMYGIEAYYEF
jgi:outer membrane receptor for ferrienterochelin and colicin